MFEDEWSEVEKEYNNIIIDLAKKYNTSIYEIEELYEVYSVWEDSSSMNNLSFDGWLSKEFKQ